MSCTPIDIHKSKLRVANRHKVSVGWRYSTMVFYTNLGNTFSQKPFSMGTSLTGTTYTPTFAIKWIQ